MIDPIKQTIISKGPRWMADKAKNCGCEKRREILNRMFPFSQS